MAIANRNEFLTAMERAGVRPRHVSADCHQPVYARAIAYVNRLNDAKLFEEPVPLTQVEFDQLSADLKVQGKISPRAGKLIDVKSLSIAGHKVVIV